MTDLADELFIIAPESSAVEMVGRAIADLAAGKIVKVGRATWEPPRRA